MKEVKTMKKKMVALGALLLAVVLTGHSVSGTYAKYTSAFDLVDEARVAKWAFTLNGDEPTGTEIDMDLFKESYPSFDGASTDTVSSEAGVNVVAPGTFGEYLFTLDGSAETNYTVAMDATIDNEIVDGSYNPIFFRLDGGAWMNSSDFETALESLYAGKVFEAGDPLNNKTHKIEWVWAFDTKNNVSSATGNQDDLYFDSMPTFTTDDELDTYLAQPKADDTYRTIKVNIKLTITQSELQSNAWVSDVADLNS